MPRGEEDADGDRERDEADGDWVDEIRVALK
jgi:hypothetical protein